MSTNKTQAEQLPQDAVMQSVFKASDLRIGNYVTCGKENHIVSHVNHDDTIRVCKDKESEKYFSFYNLDVFKPIPLTEEWLAKLGYDLISENHYGVLGHLIWKIEDRFYCDKNGVQLKYVHQLQNLYFALTGSELTVA